MKKNYDNWSINHGYDKKIIKVYIKTMIKVNYINIQNDLLDKFYYFKYHHTILKKSWKNLFSLKINLIIHKASFYL